MATKFDGTIAYSNSTDAQFRAWVQFVDDLFITTGGWTHTADTGQMTVATSLHPTVANTKVGYRVYAMADALQATAPVFLRVDYGASIAANSPGMWLTFGTGSDGAGNITGLTFNGGGVATATVNCNSNSVSTSNCYGSADSGRLQFLMFVQAAATNNCMLLSIERTRDSSGAATATGLMVVYATNAGGPNATRFINTTPGSQPPAETGITVALSNNVAFGGNVGVGMPIFFNGIAQPVGLGVIAVNSADFGAEASVSFSVYGTAHTWQLGQGPTNQLEVPTGGGGLDTRASTRIGIRYE